MGKIRCVDDARHDEDNPQPDFQKALIFPKVAAYRKFRIAYIERIHKRGKYKEKKICRIMLGAPLKKRREKRMLQKDEAKNNQPCGHTGNLHTHLRADEVRRAAARLLPHIACTGRLIAEHDGAKTVHNEIDKEQMRHAQRFPKKALRH